jgi:uncharacterized membrane protein
MLLSTCSAVAAVRINSVLCSNSTVSKGQTGIVLYMEVENLDALNPVSVSMATLTYSLGEYETTLNSPALPSSIAAGDKEIFQFTVSVMPLSDSGVCTIDGEVNTSGGNDTDADLVHEWTIQQPAEIVVSTVLGASEVTRGSSANQVIMDVGRSGEADVLVNSADLRPANSSNYSDWRKISPEFPQNFAKTYWWDDRWFYRKQMAITNRSSKTLPESYEISMTFDHQSLVNNGKSLASGDDVRVVFFDGVTFTEIDRYLDPFASGWNQNDTTIWFRLQSHILPAPASSDKYAIYYGTDAVTANNPPDNPSNIFVFFEDFESGTNGWSQGRFPGYTGGYGDRWELGTANNGDDQIDDDRRGPVGPRSGGNYWATDLDNTYNNSGHATMEIISLRSPDIDLVGKLNPSLFFWDFYDIENGGAYDFGKLRICEGPVPAQSDPMQANGTELQLLESAYLNQHAPWAQQSYSLAPSVGKTVYAEFTFGSDWAVNSYGWAIDDVLVRQIAVPEPDNPILGVEEEVPLTPTIKVYFEVDVADAAVAGNDLIDGVASGTEGNTGQEISDEHATLPLEWFIRGQNFKIYSNVFYSSAKDTFNVGETIFGKGTGYNPSLPYLVNWIDPSYNTITSNKVFPDSSGNLYDSRTMLVSDKTGKWKIQITDVSGSSVYAETSFNLNSPSQLVTEMIIPEEVVVGQQFNIIQRVSNAGQTRAIGVTSSALTVWGGGGITALTGPSPSTLTVDGGSSSEFVWTAVANGQGEIAFRAHSEGTVEGTTTTVSSADVTSNICFILQESAQIDLVEADDTIVNKGQNGLEQRVTIQNSGTADLEIADLDLIYMQGVTDESDKYDFSIVQPQLPEEIQGTAYPSWWNTNYNYRHRLRLVGDENNYAAGCSARITIDTNQFINAGQMQADADDWRVVFWDDVAGNWQELDRHYVSNEITWFNLQRALQPYGIDEGYYIYYGNPSATNPPENLDNVYLFFEDFETPVRGNGFTRYNANNDINGDGEWTVGTSNEDGVYIARNRWDGGNPLFRDAQALCFRRLDFGNTNPFAEVFRTIDTQTYPNLILSLWRYYDDNCDWNGGTSMDWAGIDYWDGSADQEVIFYPGNGPDDSTWHYEEYDLSGFNTNAAARLRFKANFWLYGADNRDRIVYDDIRCIMAAPDCVGLAQETQHVTNVVATFAVNVLPSAPTGLYTLDASGTFKSIIATGTIVDKGATTTDSWTVAPQSIETFSDIGLTVSEDKFPLGSTVYADFNGFTPGGATVRWYDGYPTGNLMFTDNPTADGFGNFYLDHAIPAGSNYGKWAIAVSQGGIQVATGSFRVIALPQIGTYFSLSPVKTTVGEEFTADLQVIPCISASDFNSLPTGLPPSDWTVNQPAKILVDDDSAYENNPPTNFLCLESNTATTLRAEKTMRLRGCSNIALSFDYSTILAGACTLVVEFSTNGGGSWSNLTTLNENTGANIWNRINLSIPDSAGNSADFRIRFSFSTSGGGTDVACLDNVFVKASSINFEDVIFEPKSWVTDPSGSGDASIVGSPSPASMIVSPGETAEFTSEFVALTETTIGSYLYLHGPGAPATLASGTSLTSSTILNASDTLSNGIEIFLEDIDVAPASVNLGSVEPGDESGIQTLTVSNTGNFDLEYLKWEFYNLASDPYFISNNAITVDPNIIGALSVGANTNADIKVMVPAGTEAGTYKANQFVFEDNDQNGSSVDEPIGQFELSVTVPQVEKLRAATDSLFLGSFLAGETTATSTILVTNVGNVNLSLVRFVPVELTSGGNSIASGSFNFMPFAQGFLVKGSSYFQKLSVSIPGGTPTGTYTGTCYFLDDKNANLNWEPGEASYPIDISLEVGSSEGLSLSTNIETLPDTLPGEIAQTGNITITNTGNIPLNYLKFEIATLTVSGNEIGTDFITFDPAFVDPIPDGGNDTFKVSVVMPPGQPNPGGRYSGVQRVYNDKNENGIWDAGEAEDTFTLRIRPGNNRGFVIADEIANLGAGIPGDSLTGNVEVINIGNDASDRLKWFITATLDSGGDTIPSGILTYQPANGWALSNAKGASQVATVSLTIPLGQPAGTYVGECVLYRDANNNSVYGDDGDASDTFIIQLEVGNDGVDILETSPMDFGQVKPGDSSDAKVVSVKNIGERTLTNLKYVKPDLTSGFNPPITSDKQVYSEPDPIGLIAADVTVGPTVYINVPANAEGGIYNGQLRVYQDENDNDVYDGASEVTDILDYTLEVLNFAVLQVQPGILDLGSVNKGQTALGNLSGINVGNIDLTRIRYQLSDLTDGGNSIPIASQTLQLPETPWSIPYTGLNTELATFSVQTAFNTPTGNYTGIITFWEDTDLNGLLDIDETVDYLEVRLAIGEKNLEILEGELNYGVVQKGNDSSVIKFTTRNIGTVSLSNTRIVKSPLLGPGTIPIGDLNFSTSFITPPKLNPGVTRETDVYISPDASLPSGVYSGIQKVYEDLNGNGSFDSAFEPYDDIKLSITVTSGGVLSYELVPDPGAITATLGRGDSSDLSFQLKSLCSNQMTNIEIQKNDLASGATLLPQANITFNPSSGIVLDAFLSIDATATISVPGTLAAGRYTGYQHAVDLDHSVASTDILLDITVPESVLNLNPSSLDMGTLQTGSTFEGGFEVQNTGMNDANMLFTFDDFIGSSFTIPAASASELIPSYFLFSGGSVLASVSIDIGTAVPAGNYVGTLTVNDFDFPLEGEDKMGIEFVVESSTPNSLVNTIYQTVTNNSVPDSISTSTKYVYSTYVCATDTVNNALEAKIQVREWRYNDSVTPLATHTLTLTGAEINSRLNNWFRVSESFVSSNSGDLGSFTFEIIVENGNPGDSIGMDGFQLEKAWNANGIPSDKPTPWIKDKGIVSPIPETGLEDKNPYYTW